MKLTPIGGTLDTVALARLHFTTLDRDQKAQAIRRLAAIGQSEYTIASATGLAVEFIRRVLAEQEAAS